MSSQTSVDILPPAVPAQYIEPRNSGHPQDYMDQYHSYTSQYSSTGYGSYDDIPAYLQQSQQPLVQGHPNMYNSPLMGMPQQSQMGISPQPLDGTHMNGYYSNLEQYSRVQSVGDIKMATQQFEASRHGVSMSQPDLSTANWREENKYQVL